MIAIALMFGPPEFFWLGVFALTIIGSLAGDSILKGLAGGAIGLLISSVGISHGNELARFTFGIPELRGGVSLVAGLIGVFAVPQVLLMVSELRKKDYIAEYVPKRGVAMKTIREVLYEPVRSAASSESCLVPVALSPQLSRITRRCVGVRIVANLARGTYAA
jgi:putative tricarboxylic transport membrane protein